MEHELDESLADVDSDTFNHLVDEMMEFCDISDDHPAWEECLFFAQNLVRAGYRWIPPERVN